MTQRGAYNRSVYDAIAYQAGLDPASPDTVLRRTLPGLGLVATTAITSGRMRTTPVVCEGGDLVTNISVEVSTASATQTSGFMALFDPDGRLVGTTADQGSTVFGLGLKTLPLAAAVTLKKGGLYRVGVCVAASTPVALYGCRSRTLISAAGEPIYCSEPATTYTTAPPNTLPAAVANPEPFYAVLT